MRGEDDGSDHECQRSERRESSSGQERFRDPKEERGVSAITKIFPSWPPWTSVTMKGARP